MSHIEDGTLHAYLDGESRPHEREAIEAHLAVCEECRARLDEARTVTSEASEILDHLEPRPTRRPSWQELEERAAARGRLARKRRWLHPGLGWAASIILAFGMGWLARSSYLSEPELSPVEVARQEAPADVSEIAAAGRAGRVDELATRASEDAAVPPAPRFEEKRAEALAEEPGTVDPTAADRRAAARQPNTLEQEEAGPGEPNGRPVESPPTQAAKAEATRQTEGTEPPADARSDRDGGAPATTAKERARSETAEADEPEPEESADWAEVITRDLHRIAGERREAEPGRAVAALTDSPRALEHRDALIPTGGAGIVVPDAFFRLAPAEAARWLGAPLRTLPELELQAVEVGPGTAVANGVTGRPVVRLIYQDTAGTEITLIQQLAWAAQDRDETEPTLLVLPSGRRAYRWLDDRGYWLTISGDLSAESLRALADRVR